MRSIEGNNRIRNGLVGIIILALVIGVGQSFASVPMIFAQPNYYAQFTDTGGLNPGDKVRIAGVDVGEVQSMEIEGDKVVIGYTLNGMKIGTDSRANIRTDTILGRKNLELEPKGSTTLGANGVLPLGQTTTPYQIYDAFFDVTKAASGWDTESVKKSLNVLSETIDQTYPHLSAALDGVSRFSDTIGKRDEDIRQLLANANKIAGVLGSRSGQINDLLVNAKTLLAAINERSYAVSMLLERVGDFSTQVKGFIDDNPNLNRVLTQLQTISDVLVARKFDLADTLTSLSKFTASLAEALASGPYFKVMLVNLLPYWILQPWVDAAFKKRGIAPVLGQRRPPVVPVPGSERPAATQRCTAAGADAAGGHAGASRSRRHRGLALLVHAGPRQLPDAGQPPAMHAGGGRTVRPQPVRRQHLRTAGRARCARESRRTAARSRRAECSVPR
jgi:phospholipid/cholesterol/gamma-HCH transport system substrate-binding protein